MHIAKLSYLRVRNKELAFGTRTYVMGIVNVTPDSFSNDGIVDIDKAVDYALQQIEKGADIIDVGGQSTRPGHESIDEETEAKRIIPVVRALRKTSDAIISVDTFSPVVLDKAVAAGADMLNSVHGLTDELLQFIKQKPLPIIIMHNGNVVELQARTRARKLRPYGAGDNRCANDGTAVNEEPVGAPVSAPVRSDDIRRNVGARSDSEEPVYENGVVTEVVNYLSIAAQKALSAGLTHEQIILDPGIGFGKTADENIEILSQFKKITALGFPTLVGSSRKSTIGKLIDRPVDQRVFGTAATVAFAIAQLVDIVRVHDVEEIIDVVKVSDALIRNWRPSNWKDS